MPLLDWLERHGEVPLPPYIAAKRPTDAADQADYQTMFAREEGAVAAPTAGLHFDAALLDALARRLAESLDEAHPDPDADWGDGGTWTLNDPLEQSLENYRLQRLLLDAEKVRREDLDARLR